MRKALFVVLILACGWSPAEARRHGHRHHRDPDPYAYGSPRQRFTPQFQTRAVPREPAGRPIPRKGAEVAVPREARVPGENNTTAPAGAASSDVEGRQRFSTATDLVPDGWQQQPTDQNWKGKRYLSPDGA